MSVTASYIWPPQTLHPLEAQHQASCLLGCLDLIESVHQRACVQTSLTLNDALHARWLTILRSMRAEDFRRTFRHPEYEGDFSIDGLVALYAWHGRHHVAHITSLRDRMHW